MRLEQARRNANWHVEPRHSRLRDVLYGLLGALAFLALCIDDIRF